LIVDSSALIAIAVEEPIARSLVTRLRRSDARGVGTPTLVETGIVLGSRIGTDVASASLSILLERFDIRPVAFGDRHWREALRAALHYGRGRHPAALNFGDCLTYAVAKLSGQPLLCTGDDFARTDLVLA
jgi:ribonuclease VapC